MVTTVADGGAGSLRDALAQADLLPGKDTIKFKLPAAPDNGENIITLTTGELTSKGNITISGPGSGKLIVSGNNASRVLKIFDAADGRQLTTISGISIVSGYNSGGNGGGIYCLGSLSLRGVVVSGNNAALGAGGVSVEGFTSSVTISSSQIVNNSSSGFAGGLSINGLKSIRISNSTISGNNGGIGGGAILKLDRSASDGSISVTGCTVSGNVASSGGGLVVEGTSPSNKIIIKSCTITGNTSTGTGTGPGGDGGGGLRFRRGTISVAASTIANNTSVYNGGGIMLDIFASLTISKSNIIGNRTTASNDVEQGGGGVYIVDSANDLHPATITGCSISSNSSYLDGGGVLVGRAVSLTISNSKFTANRAVRFGGGVATFGTGALKSDLIIKGGTFTANYSGFAGGAISTFGEGKLSVTGAKVLGNISLGYGGGILGSSTGASGEILIKNCIVAGNGSYYGGGIYIDGTPNFNIVGGSITNNSASFGGGICILNSTGSIQRATIKGNIANGVGGGVFIAGAGAVALHVGRISANTAPFNPNISGDFTII